MSAAELNRLTNAAFAEVARLKQAGLLVTLSETNGSSGKTIIKLEDYTAVFLFEQNHPELFANAVNDGPGLSYAVQMGRQMHAFNYLHSHADAGARNAFRGILAQVQEFEKMRKVQ